MVHRFWLQALNITWTDSGRPPHSFSLLPEKTVCGNILVKMTSSDFFSIFFHISVISISGIKTGQANWKTKKNFLVYRIVGFNVSCKEMFIKVY